MIPPSFKAEHSRKLPNVYECIINPRARIVSRPANHSDGLRSGLNRKLTIAEDSFISFISEFYRWNSLLSLVKYINDLYRITQLFTSYKITRFNNSVIICKHAATTDCFNVSKRQRKFLPGHLSSISGRRQRPWPPGREFGEAPTPEIYNSFLKTFPRFIGTTCTYN